MKNILKITSLALTLVLALAFFACDEKRGEEHSVSLEELEGDTDLIRIGEGEKSFLFTVIDGENEDKVYLINTDKKTVGEALFENSLIEGEAGPYGLYVKKVCGVEANFDKTHTYWAFYCGGEYATAGVDKTEIPTDRIVSYAFKVE